MPFVRPSCEAIKAVAKTRGYVRSIGGRIHHCPPDGGLYKVVNYLIQGSAADILKLGLRKAWQAGVFSVLKAHLTVHDEVVFSIPQTKEGVQAAEALAEAMLTDVKLKVPIRIDKEIGPDWSSCTYDNWVDLQKRVA
jgi:DNA polymerase I-like protein with 3'-5' exonuclease and polymerase domains